MEVDKGINLDETESIECVNSNVKLEKEYEGCSRCLVLQNRIKNAQDKCRRLELDIESKKSLIRCMEIKIGIMEMKILEEEIRTSKQMNWELENNVQNDIEEDKFTQLIIENKDLECEKNWAETELESWKKKFKELEMRVKQLENGVGHDHNKMAESASPPINTPLTHGFKKHKSNEFKSGVMRGLNFSVEGGLHQHLSPSTPGGRSCFIPIDISDSDDGINTAQGMRHSHCSGDIGLGVALGEKESTVKDGCKSVENHTDENEINSCSEELACPPTHKRKRIRRGIAYIVNSESESDYDDNIPISQLVRKPLFKRTTDDNLSNTRSKNNTSSGGKPKRHPPRRRLVRVGECKTRAVSYTSNESQNKTTMDGCEIEEDDSSSEGGNLGGFLVDDSYVSEEDDPVSNCNVSSENQVSENDKTFSGDGLSASESSVAYDGIISSLRRERKDKLKWSSEGEMLSDFGEYPELCMKAVCALHRQQTPDEKWFKATVHINGRGFSQYHALMGSKLAEFLTDGDSHSDVKKSVEELKEFDAEGSETCWKLATHYSKQLFKIYKNGEDPFFNP